MTEIHNWSHCVSTTVLQCQTAQGLVSAPTANSSVCRYSECITLPLHNKCSPLPAHMHWHFHTFPHSCCSHCSARVQSCFIISQYVPFTYRLPWCGVKIHHLDVASRYTTLMWRQDTPPWCGVKIRHLPQSYQCIYMMQNHSFHTGRKATLLLLAQNSPAWNGAITCVTVQCALFHMQFRWT